MKESSILETTRKYSLWVAIVTAVALLVLLIMWTWGVFNLTDMESLYNDMAAQAFLGDSLGGMPGFSIFTGWAKTMLTLSAISSTATSILLTLLIAKYAKKEK